MYIKIIGYLCLSAFLLLTCVELVSAFSDLDQELIELSESDDIDERDSDDNEDELESKINGPKNNLALFSFESVFKSFHRRNIGGQSGLFISTIHEPPEV